jgi:hypothetical protein
LLEVSSQKIIHTMKTMTKKKMLDTGAREEHPGPEKIENGTMG